MKELDNLGISLTDIESILKMCPSIGNLTDIEIQNNIDTLRMINCTDNEIKNIIIANPVFLSRTTEEILELIKKLMNLEINNLNLLFVENPNLLNKYAYEIDNYINRRIKEGNEIDSIIEDIKENSYVIDEI